MKRSAFLILTAIFLITAGLLYYAYQARDTNSGNEAQTNVQEAPKKDTREIVWEQLSEQGSENGVRRTVL